MRLCPFNGGLCPGVRFCFHFSRLDNLVPLLADAQQILGLGHVRPGEVWVGAGNLCTPETQTHCRSKVQLCPVQKQALTHSTGRLKSWACSPFSHCCGLLRCFATRLWLFRLSWRGLIQEGVRGLNTSQEKSGIIHSVGRVGFCFQTFPSSCILADDTSGTLSSP